jgi:monovalent cation/hydrogen antiporter
VSCGLVISYFKSKLMTPELLAQAISVWDFSVRVLESLVFVLIGLSLRHIVQGLHTEGISYTTILPIIAAIATALTLARFAWIMPHVWLDRLRSHLRSLPESVPNTGLVAVAGWAGMRGGVSLAAALALPSDFPGRNSILAITFGVILISVLGHATTLAPLARRLGITEESDR